MRQRAAQLDGAIINQAQTSFGHILTGLEDRRRLRLAACHATTECAKAVDRLYDAGGGTSVYRSCSLQRHHRDVHTATQHRMVGTQAMQIAGAVKLLGRAPGDDQL